MATIRAKIQSEDFDKCDILIVGDGTVRTIDCDDDFAKLIVSRSIKNGDGWIANAYYPLPNTMLQAYATVLRFANEDDISVNGDIGEIPGDEGVVY